MANSTNKRIVQLDVLRGVAILLVLCAHFPKIVPGGEAGACGTLESVLGRFGATGVDLFFVLSGFLIGSLLLKEIKYSQRLDVFRFITRRGLKIWPPYFALLVYAFLFQIIVRHSTVAQTFRYILPNLLHVQNYLGSIRVQTWSLAVEEHFYLVLPFIICALFARGTRPRQTSVTVFSAVVGLIVICTVLRYLTVSYWARMLPQPPGFFTHLRIDNLFVGVGLSFVYHFSEDAWQFLGRIRIPLAITALACLITAQLITTPTLYDSLGGTLTYLGYASLMIAVLHTKELGGREIWQMLPAKIVAFIGIYSYSIYLWHIDAIEPLTYLRSHGLFGNLTPEFAWLVWFLLYVLVAVISGYLAGLAIERPILAIRDRLFAPKFTVAPEDDEAVAL